jgi:tetratricopeptide (TPR) repeat protein
MNMKTAKVLALSLAVFSSGLTLYGQTEESAKILAQTGPSVMSLVAYGKDKQEIARGSAFAISEGLAATSYHLVSQAANCIGFNMKKKEVDILGVVAVDKNLDLALVKYDGKVTPLSQPGAHVEMAPGSKIFAVGANEAGEIIISDGSMRGFFDLSGNRKVADVSLAVPGTFSGCLVVEAGGKALGLVQLMDSRLKFMVPVSAILDLSASVPPKTAKVTPFKSWQPENYMETLEASWLTGQLYALMGEPYSAQKGLEKVTKSQPNNLDAWSLLAKVYDGQRDYQNSVTAFKKITDLDPKRADAFFGLGQIYIRLQQPAEALAALNQAIEIDPSNKEAFLFLGNAYEDSREFQKAGDAYEKYLATKTEKPWTVYQRLGISRLNANQFDAAAAALAEALKAQPQDANIGFNLAQAYQKAGRLQEAEETYKKLAEISPKDAGNWYSYILKMYSDAQKLDKAIEAAKKIVELKPSDELSLINLGNMYQQVQKYPEAITAYQQALKIKPGYDLAHFQIGACLYNLKRYTEAIESFKKTVAIDPDNGAGWQYLAISEMQLKRFDAALDPMKKAADLQPSSGNILYNLAVIYLNLKDKYSASDIQKKLQTIDPNLAAKLKALIK